MAKQLKTNAMRLLEQENIKYRSMEYEVDEENLAGEHVAEQIQMPSEQVFKTLVARGEKNGILVFCIPVCFELDLKKAAGIVKEKKVELIYVKELLGITGYIRGGCSPVGMKKNYPVYIDETAVLFDEISISAGVRGCQIILNPGELISFINAVECDLIE